MGDMSEFAIDCACDECEDYDRFESGRYSLEEAYDRGFLNELGEECPGPQGWNTLFAREVRGGKSSVRHKSQLACRNCGSTNVRWGQYPSGKWFLFEGDKPHRCTKIKGRKR